MPCVYLPGPAPAVTIRNRKGYEDSGRCAKGVSGRDRENSRRGGVTSSPKVRAAARNRGAGGEPDSESQKHHVHETIEIPQVVVSKKLS